jgi:hypothetical protein
MNHYRVTGRATLVLGLPLLLAACASGVPRPDAQLQEAQNAIQQAETANAQEAAPVLLNNAEQKLEDARALIERDEYARASRLLDQATADAQLAAARAETAETAAAAAQLNESVELLREQMRTGQ